MQICARLVSPLVVERLVAREFSASLQRFIRENFGLYSPPADYAALRRENLKRSAAAANRPSLRPQ